MQHFTNVWHKQLCTIMPIWLNCVVPLTSNLLEALVIEFRSIEFRSTLIILIKKADWAVLSDAPYKKHWCCIITYLPCTGNCNSIGIKMFLCLKPVHWTNLIKIKAFKQHEELILSTNPCRISTCRCYVAYVYNE